jgi:hypothetical protein
MAEPQAKQAKQGNTISFYFIKDLFYKQQTRYSCRWHYNRQGG